MFSSPNGYSSLYKQDYRCNDTVSASSNMDMEDRVSHLEQRLQLQEDEIQLLKAALADALRRLGFCEEQSLVMQKSPSSLLVS
uniref:Uncharacterized protein n=1 Tax=Seriola lalandi dorsalis TaxID=1841481 RepID=A0A3B4WNU3_SERLL